MFHSRPDVYLLHPEALIRVMTGAFVIEQQQLSHTLKVLYVTLYKDS